MGIKAGFSGEGVGAAVVVVVVAVTGAPKDRMVLLTALTIVSTRCSSSNVGKYSWPRFGIVRKLTTRRVATPVRNTRWFWVRALILVEYRNSEHDDGSIESRPNLKEEEEASVVKGKLLLLRRGPTVSPYVGVQ